MQGSFDFTDDEIRAELRKLGYVNVPEPRLAEFREDLKQLISFEHKNSSVSSEPSSASLCTSHAVSSINDLSTSASNRGPLAATGLRQPNHGDGSRAGSLHGNAGSRAAASSTRPEMAAQLDKENMGAGTRNTKLGHKTYNQLLLPHDGRWSPSQSRQHPGQGSKSEVAMPPAHGPSLGVHSTAGRQATLRSAQWQQPFSAAGSEAQAAVLARMRRMPEGRGDDQREVHRAAGSAPRQGNDSDDVDRESEDMPSFMKRKVLRKRGGRAEVCDESIATSTSDADNVSALSERLFRMPALNDTTASPGERLPAETRSARVLTQQHAHGGRRADSPDQSAVGQRRSAAGGRGAGSGGNACRSSVIIPSDPASARAVSRCDPVRRHLEYERFWAAHKMEEDRQQKGLRWRVRERMLVRDVVYQKRQWQYEPNTYEVPTAKQRKALRWQVRADMAHGVLPATGRRV